MITVGAFEAKTHFSMLLERVAGGEEVVITKHGKPVARMIAAATRDQADVDDAVEQLIERVDRLEELADVAELADLLSV